MEEEESPSILDAAEAMEPESEKDDPEVESLEAVESSEQETSEAQSEDTTEESTDQDYQSMTVAELKELLKAAGKPVSGKKADLIARLQE